MKNNITFDQGLNQAQTHSLTLDSAMNGTFKSMTLDSAMSGMAFLEGELEKRDPKLREPLTSVTWHRDMPVKSGGGFMEKTSTYFVDYATTGGNENGIIGGQTNTIPILQGNVGKDIFDVFTWANNIKIPLVDQQKLQGIGRSLDDIFDKGLRLNYNKTLDYNVYVGFQSLGKYGLVTNPNVTHNLVAAGASGKTAWNTKTPTEILNDIDNLIEAAWEAGNYDVTAIPNQILLPPAQFAYINRTIVSNAGNISILNYLEQNNIAKANGVDLKIVYCRQCKGVGVAASDRMVAYVNDEDKINMDVTVPLSKYMTMPDVNTLSYLSAYVSQFSQVKVLYYQPIQYGDGI